MGFGSFKDRIKQAAGQVEASVSEAVGQAESAVAGVVEQAESAVAGTVAGVQQAVAGGLGAWASQIGQAAQVASGVLGAGAGLLGAVGGGAAAGGGAAPADAPAELDCQFNGRPLDPKQVWVERLQVRRAVNEIPTATVWLTLPRAEHDDYATLTGLLEQGAIGRPFSMKAGKRMLFAGVVATVQVNVSGTERRLKVRIKHALQGLKARQTSRILKQGPDAGTLKQVLGEHGVKATVSLPTGEPVQRVQWNCSDWTVVRALAGQHGAWLWPQADGGVTIAAPKLGGKTHRVAATPEPNGLTLLEAEWAYSGLTQPQQVQTTSWDLGKQAAVEKTAKPASLGAGGLAPNRIQPLKDESWRAVLDGQWDPAVQQSATDSWMTQHHAQAVWGQWALAGCQAIELGDTLELAGFGAELSGKSIVTRVEYEIDASLRVGKTIVGVGLEEEAAIAPSLPAPAGLTLAKVAKYQADAKPATWNRVPVTVPLLGSAVLWARMGHPYASTQSGVTFYPEADDEVALGWVGADPVIVASLHNPKQVAAFAPSAKNAKKGIVLRRDGKRLELSFDRDQHAAQWAVGADATPEQQLAIDAEKGLTFASKKGQVKVAVDAGDVTWATKQSFKVSATEQVTLDGKTGVKVSSAENVSLDAKAKLVGQGKASVAWSCEQSKLSLTPETATLSATETAVKATLAVKVSGNEGVSVRGAKVDVQGEAEVSVAAAKVDVKGEAQASVSGAQVKVAGEAMTNVGGSGITNVKGAMVNLG
ncbi:phage baseplate assembly protein V [Burkholderia stagnalis]|uniref:Gp5/Type VI secretion system Vgr protein OB-fold domain-containing protein n=1 Tax=Burkholderia stagnalis TaxID=1503054 RepID=A0ABX9YFC6_9BURK|nr:contractile injection system protein, VgrG/Pvc8 family [Burkholderia stagnalis]RQQ47910.1 hypothetical protein DF158_33420 [Burkholderia stagnalis]RQQ59564.1 hypothetical protein DF137_33390 [Burkholderia stagnalis]RQQ60018.1 hypothetical protein DF139_33345 [Burkholderia stagnalis]RQQ74674.1 hypothetical protein DF138_32775 [Burkholderia stagnalis]RQQ80261.1 hypothetical protein DF134_33510 [Burkholderia stagnalis]